MNNIVLGAQFGDEGKGKIVDYLSEDANIVVRYSGGANAGHSIVIGNNKYALHLIPSGIINPNTKVVLGTGMVIDLEALSNEIDTLTKAGINCDGRIFISDRAHLVLPSMKQEDRSRDAARAHPIGTTGRGIGIAYEKKASRDGIRVADIDNVDQLVDGEDLVFLDSYKNILNGKVVNLPHFLSDKQSILFEGAQGALLDIDSGTYPYVSSSTSGSAGALIGGGIGMRKIDNIIGVVKAYTSRVGNGPFPTEFTDKEANLCNFIRETGHEYGVTTGRPRRCGYLDLVALKYACEINSITNLALTHLDILDSLDEITYCSAYNGFDYFPTNLDGIEPVYKKISGWKTSTAKMSKLVDLPIQAREYISIIEQYCDVPVDIISTGSDRADTISRWDFWGAKF